MAFTDGDRLRWRLGETVPAAGADTDTMFTNAQIQDFLSQAGGSLTSAALEGWQAKAAEYANLVDVSEGNSSRAMSDLHKNAMLMIEKYRKELADELSTTDSGGRKGRVVIGEISRSKQRNR